MPDFVEPLVSDLVTSFSTYSESERSDLSSVISPETSFVLGWYARKLAGRSVRESSRADLWNALMALAISASNGDARDILAPLALVYSSALRLGENPEALLEAAAEVSPQHTKNLFHEFLIRPASEKSIYTFGFTEGKGPLGFDYLPLLPEYGGPTPLDSGGPTEARA
jgi:hypothetical protein